VDNSSLPEAVVLGHVLAETINGLTRKAGHAVAVDFPDSIEENPRLHTDSLNADTFAAAKRLFRLHEPLSLVDACLVAYSQTNELRYLYAFDDDFDAVDGVVCLDTASNPYDSSP
jgi:hypothetical protein